MKTIKAFVVVAVVVSSLPVLAQQADVSAQQSATVSTPSSQTSQSAAADASASRHGASAQGSGAAANSAALNGLSSSSSTSNGANSGATAQAFVQHDIRRNPGKDRLEKKDQRGVGRRGELLRPSLDAEGSGGAEQAGYENRPNHPRRPDDVRRL